LLTNLSQDYPF